MADIGVPELLIILAILLLVFGPSKIMGAASGLGQALRTFRESVRDNDETTPAENAPAAPDEFAA